MSRVSLVMAVFNQLSLTRACLESLRPTTVTFDLVVVDNGSTDGTAEFLRAFPYPFPFRAHQNQGNLGLIRALNQGWRLAGGEFVCFLHNDTEMRDPRWLERLVAALQGGRGGGPRGPGRGGAGEARRPGRGANDRALPGGRAGDAGARGRGGGCGRGVSLPPPEPAGDARRLRRGVRLLPRLRPGPVVRGEGGGRPVRRRERPFHSPGRWDARLRRRRGAAR